MGTHWSIETWRLALEAVSAAALVVLAVAVLWGMSHERKRGPADAREYGSVRDWIAREPVRFRAYVAAVVGAGATVLAAVFGVEATSEQVGAIVGLIVAVAVAASEMGRRKVTPVKRPNLPAGEKGLGP